MLNQDIGGDISVIDVKPGPITKTLDYARLAKLCQSTPALVRKNMHDLLSHLVTMIQGNNYDSDFTKGKLLRLDFKVGVLNI